MSGNSKGGTASEPHVFSANVVSTIIIYYCLLLLILQGLIWSAVMQQKPLIVDAVSTYTYCVEVVHKYRNVVLKRFRFA